MAKRIKYGIVILIVLISGGFVVLKLIGSGDFYITPSEVMNERTTSSGQLLRVGGLVMNSSLKSEGGFGGAEITFELRDAKESLAVAYQGVIPNTFRDGANVIAEGTLDGKQSFKASRILVKCPESYMAERALSGALKNTKLEQWLYR